MTTAYTQHGAARPAGRRRRRGGRWLVVVVVLLALVAVADRVGRAVAQTQVADRLQQSQSLSSKPTVRIEGIPFLTQAIRGRYPDVRIAADGLVLSRQGRSVRISHFSARLRDVTVSRDFSRATAASATGTALINYTDLSAAAGVPVSFAGNGRVTATKTVSLLGVDVRGSVTAGLRIAGNTVTFVSPEVAVGGTSVPQQLTDLLAGLLDKPIELSGLPAGLGVKAVTATATGLSVNLTATDIRLK